MKVSGSSRLRADRESVWRALTDPAVLVAAVPGCKRLEALGEDAFKMTVAVGVGSVKGLYDGQVRLTDQRPPASFRMRAEGAGASGTIGADVLVTLADDVDGGTELAYDADATVGGMIGGVGQRMLAGVSKRMAEEFFGNVDAILAGEAPAGLSAEGVSAGLSAEGVAPNQPPSSVGRRPGPSTVATPSSVHPAASGPAGRRSALGAPAGTVFTAPERPASSAVPSGLVVGVVLGAAAALAGAIVGGWIAGRRPRHSTPAR